MSHEARKVTAIDDARAGFEAGRATALAAQAGEIEQAKTEIEQLEALLGYPQARRQKEHPTAVNITAAYLRDQLSIAAAATAAAQGEVHRMRTALEKLSVGIVEIIVMVTPDRGCSLTILDGGAADIKREAKRLRALIAAALAPTAEAADDGGKPIAWRTEIVNGVEVQTADRIERDEDDNG